MGDFKSGTLTLRNVTVDDLPIFFEQQLDPVANRMAAFPARDKDAFMAHWGKLLADDPGAYKTVVFDGQVAGNVVSWQQSGKRLVGYWIGQDYWRKGIATKALREYIGGLGVRPLHAHVAKHNAASIRVLEKCGFKVSGQDVIFSEVHGHEIEEALFTLV